ncbi:MAG: hybrid sensor histidine kinase/response regulator [Deltaproteobacteria bacterium]|nr:hybrid sensor histidine kinase/response regulator [Deltaproteobacteria bacterium]
MPFVIVAEANLALANFAANTLIQAGYESRGADNQTEALVMSQERRADLVLTDYVLATGDGLGLITALRKRAPDTAVAMVTGLGDERLARSALMGGALDYVIKGRDYFTELPSLVATLMDVNQKRLAELEENSRKCRLLAQLELARWLDHNFKNILSAVMGSLALIDFNNPSQTLEKRQEYLADGQDSLKSAVKLLESLTAMANVVDAEEQTGQNVLVSAVVDEAWENVVKAVKREGNAALLAALNHLSFQNHARWLSPQRVVRQDLLTILEALLTNALEAVIQTPQPRILVNVVKDQASLKFEVKDNGRGMDDKALRHAFEPLFSTKGQVGVGLSLTTVRALVDRHSGQIRLNSTLGEGTSAVFTYDVGI